MDRAAAYHFPSPETGSQDLREGPNLIAQNLLAQVLGLFQVASACGPYVHTQLHRPRMAGGTPDIGWTEVVREVETPIVLSGERYGVGAPTHGIQVSSLSHGVGAAAEVGAYLIVAGLRPEVVGACRQGESELRARIRRPYGADPHVVSVYCGRVEAR
jgi:hypothetical protein